MWRLFSFLWQLLGGRSPDSRVSEPISPGGTVSERTASSSAALSPAPGRKKSKADQKRPVLVPLTYRRPRLSDREHAPEIVSESPYRYALPYVVSQGKYLDLSQDIRPELLQRWDLPLLKTPQDLADWLHLPVGQVAWLSGRFGEGGRPADASKAHYRYSWKKKRSGGYRLIESPLPLLRQVQEQILDEILSRVPVHQAAHGFCAGRSVVTNAAPHVGQHVVIRLDLDNFYSRVRHSRVVAVFRGMGFSREVSLWLAKLVTSAIPSNLEFPGDQPGLLRLFLPRHLPQGAPTSPAVANLVAYSLDVRLAGLARAFSANYTRYGDDLTFSGSAELSQGSRLFLPLAQAIIREERFRVNSRKRRFMRQSTRQEVTGLVVNVNVNYSRQEYDRLKATLHNCVKTGWESQNRAGHPDFLAHLRGRIAYVQQISPLRGAKLLALFTRIVR